LKLVFKSRLENPDFSVAYAPQLNLFKPGIEGISQAVPEHVKTQHGDKDRQARHNGNPGHVFDKDHIGAQIPAPARRRRLRAHAQNAQARFHENRGCHFERAQRESDGRPLRPWLIRIAHNLAANYYRDRARKPQTAIEDAAIISAPHDTEALVEGREQLQRIIEGVRQLPDDRREALIMRFALGMDNREIARALGRSDGATKVLLHRATRQLEEIVKQPVPTG